MGGLNYEATQSLGVETDVIQTGHFPAFKYPEGANGGVHINAYAFHPDASA